MPTSVISPTTLIGLSLILCAAGAAYAKEVAHAAGQNMKDMKFVMFPGLPTCARGAVASGDPSKGASTILAKAPAGCTIPWHWHTPNESLMIVSGTARVQMKDEKPLTLHAGGFALMPAQHVHQFQCVTACTLYVHSDTAFDIHYVNGQGKEIPPEEALKAVKEKTVKETK
jgi:quercetin dioxygenase-like cupin family protein